MPGTHCDTILRFYKGLDKVYNSLIMHPSGWQSQDNLVSPIYLVSQRTATWTQSMETQPTLPGELTRIFAVLL